jgi:DNA gyrase inhibitor GyrI
MNKVGKLVLVSVIVLGMIVVAGVGAFVWHVNNVGHPDYTSVETDGDIEIRDYPSLVVAEVTREGDRSNAVRRGFRPLAGYIFAKERDGDRIAMTAPVTQRRRDPMTMTAPVTQTPAASSGSWAIRFIMPANYPLKSLPKPVGTEVRLAKLPEQRRAVIRFSGVTTNDLIDAKESALRKWLMERGLRPKGPPTYAYYNHPLTPGFLRRNEVMFDVAND